MLFYDFASRGPSHVHRNVAPADHNHFLADRELVSEVDIQQEIDAFVDTIEINSRNAEIAAAMSADRDQHRIEPLPPQIGDFEVTSRRMVQLEGDVSGLEDLADLGLDNIARQAILG